MTGEDTDGKQALATQRTGWAEDRTLLANERTFASWMRTGMACLGVALGLRAVFRTTEYPLIAKGVAELFVLIAILIFWAAALRSGTAHARFDQHDAESHPARHMKVVASILTLGAVATGVILWLL